MKVVCETKLCVKKGHCLWPCCPGGTRLPCSPCSIRCAAGGKAPVPLQPGKALRAALYQKAASQLKSGIPSDPGDCRAAAFLVTCSPEAERESFCPCLCWAGLWEIWVQTLCSRSGSLPHAWRLQGPLQSTLRLFPGLHPLAMFVLFKVLPSASPTPTPAGTSSHQLFSFAANLWWFIFLPVPQEVLPDIT